MQPHFFVCIKISSDVFCHLMQKWLKTHLCGSRLPHFLGKVWRQFQVEALATEVLLWAPLFSDFLLALLNFPPTRSKRTHGLPCPGTINESLLSAS